MKKEVKLPEIKLAEYTYELNDERIAKYPLAERDASKLLYYQQGKIENLQFPDIEQVIPADSVLFFNNTKVIPARIFFRKDTGAKIEVFLLNPITPSPVISQAMDAKGETVWAAMVGNAKKLKDGQVLNREMTVEGQEVHLKAEIISRSPFQVKFEWTPSDIPFVAIVEEAGTVPLPPYMNREAEDEDKPRYQTVFSKNEGAVAAPTSGLHFTDKILERLDAKNIDRQELTLHVSAGTFQPVKEENAVNHPMHEEQIIIHRHNVEAIIERQGNIYCVGTTSMRTLESLYWFGVKLIEDPQADFFVEKLRPYQYSVEELPSVKAAMTAVLQRMDADKTDHLQGSTEIFIFPSYPFQIIDGIITNFHQPGSTLIMLVAAFIGEDWKKVYQNALDKDYRFLSYGDASFLLRKK
ncbi:S-adenosylmethionine:tRNA ribosyltransferase-isomerase [Persicobacter psychrovividus]|uniref:S-adenosylmethionine:tRNA ribosyltransferase-isomerase n=1 Tax=Persicobacter psychrovividus TaxID=387638 RepID=A0ABM7VDS2_9BACT|nr:S-adenosylmethionine:tRNA ribosyltransferase-isomerase [Persicobacter psychrovividus]